MKLFEKNGFPERGMLSYYIYLYSSLSQNAFTEWPAIKSNLHSIFSRRIQWRWTSSESEIWFSFLICSFHMSVKIWFSFLIFNLRYTF